MVGCLSNNKCITHNKTVSSCFSFLILQVETNLLASCASDRSIILYDFRESGPLRKVVMELRSNALSWNPMEAFIFTVANEDYRFVWLSSFT